jgi:hypothetical protein
MPIPAIHATGFGRRSGGGWDNGSAAPAAEDGSLCRAAFTGRVSTFLARTIRLESGSVPYDRADFDYSTEEDPLPKGHAATHIGMFVAWIVFNDLIGPHHEQNSSVDLARLRRREITGRQFFEAACQGRFWERDLNENGNAFARHYYSEREGQRGRYFDDYKKLLVKRLPSFWHVTDTWENYDRIAPTITQRYNAWKGGLRKRWWQFWK